MIWSVMVKVKWNNLHKKKPKHIFLFYFALVGILVLCRFNLTRFGDPSPSFILFFFIYLFIFFDFYILFFYFSTLSLLALFLYRRRMGSKSDLSFKVIFFFHRLK